MYGLSIVTNLETQGELWPTFLWGGVKFLIADIWHTICQSAMKFGNVEGLPVDEFCELQSMGPMIPCSTMHQSFTGTLVKFFRNFPMSADSFSFLSSHCVAQVLGASFVYKCRASCSGSL